VKSKTISDNGDYVVYTPESFPVTLTLEASDGKQEQSTSVTLEKNLKNKARIISADSSLVLLVNSSSNPDEPLVNPDEIKLTTPGEQLFLYLAESQVDVYRYIIDTDIQLDTDLNGDPTDDADNSGSASYRTGRPYRLIPSKKHRQIVKITLLDRDENAIGTHTLDVVQTYIEEPVYDEPVDTQEIELSDEDKLRVNKLNQLIQNAPEEQQYQLNKYVELLLDEWYDPVARADTLFRMHQYIIESGQVSPELATEIQNQIDAIYAE